MLIKRVTFDENQNKVNLLYVWNFAYNQARKSKWQEFLLDRIRFQNKIKMFEKQSIIIFSKQHRNYVYNHYFKTDDQM